MKYPWPIIASMSLITGLTSPASGQEDMRHWLAPVQEAQESLPLRRLPALDNAVLLNEELQARRVGRAPVFAHVHEAGFTPQQEGRWETLPDGRSVWRLRLNSPQAHSLNFGFSEFRLPPGALLLLYDKDRQHILGPFSKADEDMHGTFWTPIVPGDETIIELQLPYSIDREEARLRIQYINHDFVGLPKLLNGACNIDVACIGDSAYAMLAPFREAIQAVAYYTVKGNINCTGFLVNNSRNDCTPYMVTARHCEVDSASAASMVIYWNFQNSTCRTPGSQANTRAGDGVLNRFNSGAIFRAAHTPSDIALVELDDPIHPLANAFFLGWNIDTAFTNTGIATIHHADAREKRISFSSQRPYRGLWGRGASMIPIGDHLIVPRWELGATEEGSSGGPLINRQLQALGALHGGAAACGNQLFDAFGWLGTAWEGGGTPSTSIKDWLDPLGRSRGSWPGRQASRCQKAIESNTPVLAVCNPGNGRFLLEISAAFSKTVRLSVQQFPELLNVQLENESLNPNQQTGLLVSPKPEAGNGFYPILLSATDGEDTVFLRLDVKIERIPGAPGLIYPAPDDRNIPIQPTLRWTPDANAAQYRIRIASDSAFQDVLQERLSTEALMAIQDLEYLNRYYWSVEALNPCGIGPAATGSFSTEPDTRLELRSLPKEACNSGALSFELFIGKNFLPPVRIEYLPNDGPVLPIQFHPAEPAPGEVVRVTITSLDLLDLDTYTLQFRASDGIREAFVQGAFKIKTAPLKAGIAQSLRDTAFVSSRPVLRWEQPDKGLTYFLEVSQSPQFGVLLQRHTLMDQSQKRLDPLKSGLYFWRVLSVNECGVQISDTGAFSVHTEFLNELFSLQTAIDPNPTNGPVRVLFSDPVRETGVYLYSISGQLLQVWSSMEERSSYTLDLSPYPNGVYLIRVRFRQASFTRRIVLYR